MGSVPAQFEFAASFAIFLVAAAGLALVLLRAELLSRSPWARVSLGLGFALLAAGAFLRGSLLVEPPTATVLSGLSGGGLILVLLGSLRWRAGDASQALVWLGVGLAGASIVLRSGTSGQLADGLLAAGALSIGIALVMAARQAIAARVAATAAATLLVLVFILSLALSQVVSSTVRDDAVRRLDGRASSGATQTSSSPEQLRGEAVLVGSSVRAYVNAHSNCVEADQTVVDSCVRDALSAVSASAVPAGVEVAWIVPGRGAVASSANLDATLGPGVAVTLPNSPAVAQAIAAQQSTGTASVEANRAIAVGAFPDVVIARGPGLPGTARVMGVAVAVRALDRGYLGQLRVDDPTLSVALVGPNGVLSSAGWEPAFPVVQGVTGQVLTGGAPVTSTTLQGRLVALQPVVASNNKPVMAFVASTPTTVVDKTQNDLFRTLFIIALGGTLLALLLAALVGDRVGSDLRRLTTAADSIRRGDVDVRARVRAEDEVGRLGAAFDSMAASIDDKATALRAAAEDEARLRGRLEAVVGGMGEALVAVDATGRITDFNQAAEELVLVSDNVARGRPVEEVITLIGEDGAGLSSQLLRPPEQRWTAQCWVQQNEGGLVPVAITAGALRGQGPSDAGAVFVLRDLRREQEVERMKTEFLSRVGHELRTPLTGIMGFSDLMARKPVPPNQARAWHAEILEQSKRLLRVVERLEFFASSGAGRIRMRPDWVDVKMLLDDVIYVWESRLQEPWTISRRVERDLDPLVADRRWIRLAIDELVDNAVKFSPQGGETVVTARTVRGGRVLEMSVTDQGKGMSQEEASAAFGEFVQGDSSDTRRYGGLGLGLSLVQRVAEGHGGSVAWESYPGRGSKFSLLLPTTPRPDGPDER